MRIARSIFIAALVLANKGAHISWRYYFCVGICLTVPVLLITLAALAVRLEMF